MTPRLGVAPNMTRAMGTPDASVFFEPQNMSAIRSSTEKPSARPRLPDPSSAMVSKIPHSPKVTAKAAGVCAVQTPPTTESQKDV